MSNFRTILPIERAPFSINYQHPILGIGSCFIENIGGLLSTYKFPTLLNPFGIVYNPISIKNSLNRLLSGEKYGEEELFFHQEVWQHFDYHSVFAHPDRAIALTNMNDQLATAHHFLLKTKCLLLTFGTANVFVKKNTGKVVANCHKVPNTDFEKKRLSVTDIIDQLHPVLSTLKKHNPDLTIVFTVSPVRHIRDGLLENQLSKATLLLAIEGLIKKLSFTHYFPAYELVLDDLRDYRFFKKDMIHPNELAIQYIWDYFQQTYFSVETVKLYEQVRKLVQSSQHRPFHVETAAHQLFVQKQLEKITNLEKQYPFLSLTKERAIFQAQFKPL